jgi:hypothetical protein
MSRHPWASATPAALLDCDQLAAGWATRVAVSDPEMADYQSAVLLRESWLLHVALRVRATAAQSIVAGLAELQREWTEPRRRLATQLISNYLTEPVARSLITHSSVALRTMVQRLVSLPETDVDLEAFRPPLDHLLEEARRLAVLHTQFHGGADPPSLWLALLEADGLDDVTPALASTLALVAARSAPDVLQAQREAYLEIERTVLLHRPRLLPPEWRETERRPPPGAT